MRSSNEQEQSLSDGHTPECIRRITLSRLQGMGVSTLRLPLGAAADEPHVPILLSSNLRRAKRVVVVLGSPMQDLGIWAYRTVGTESIAEGTVVSFVKAVLDDGRDRASSEPGDTAVVIANTGQLLYHRGSGRAISQRTWLALPRESAVHPGLKITTRNKVLRNGSWQEHVECVFDDVLAARGRIVSEDARFDIVGVAEGGLAAVRYLARNCGCSPDHPHHRNTKVCLIGSKWSGYISAMCLAEPAHNRRVDLFLDPNFTSDDDIDDDDGLACPPNPFADFIATRCRAYVLSDKPVGTPVPGTLIYGCNTYSSGEELNNECIMPAAWRCMLPWLRRLHDDPTYEEVPIVIPEDVDDGGWEAGGKVRS